MKETLFEKLEVFKLNLRKNAIKLSELLTIFFFFFFIREVYNSDENT